jgi:uncharacterized protein (TIGR03435 family)
MLSMLQNLLAGRFGLRSRWEEREVPVYVLLAGDGRAKLVPAAPRDSTAISRDVGFSSCNRLALLGLANELSA